MAFRFADTGEYLSGKPPIQPQQPVPQDEQEPGSLMNDALQSVPVRGLARSAARVGESILGAPGDIVQAVKSIGQKVLPQEVQQALGAMTQFNPALRVANAAPSTEDIRKNVTEPLTGEYLKPQGPAEETFDEFARDLGSFASPLSIGGKLKPLKAATVSGMGILGKTLAKGLGAGEGGQEFTKIASQILGGTFGGRNAAMKLKDADYAKVDERLGLANKIWDKDPMHQKALGNILREDVSKLKDVITQAKKAAELGAKTPEKAFFLEKMDELKTKIVGNYINPLDLHQWKKDINDLFIYNWEMPAQVKKAAMPIKNQTMDVLKAYGQKVDPQFMTSLLRADELHSALSSSYVLRKTAEKFGIDKVVSNKFVKNALFGPTTEKIGFALGSALGAYKHPGLAGAAVAGTSAYRFGRLISKSPAARKVYGDVLKNASAGNAKVLARDLTKLSSLADKFDKSEPDNEENVTTAMKKNGFSFAG